ncbi:MAG: alpha/beta hydrolase [Chitinophagaceae bacterium]|nr:alpha/beta hydrolase [Chitinophagaceae bacterium]
MRENTLKNEQGSLYYRVYGEGDPVVLLHGFGTDGTIWENQVSYLEKKYRLIVPDLPGSGRSTRRDDPLSMEMLADNILHIVENERISHFSLIGHSMGGYITLAFAEKYPDRLRSFGLFHSTAYADDETKINSRKKNIAFINRHGSAKYLSQAIPGFFSADFKASHPATVNSLVARHSGFSAPALTRYIEAMINRPDRTSVLKNFTGPVLFIAGEHDSLIPLEHTLTLCKIPELSYIYICAQSGHLGMLEEPEFCSKALDTFLSYDEIN